MSFGIIVLPIPFKGHYLDFSSGSTNKYRIPVIYSEDSIPTFASRMEKKHNNYQSR
jgi:hypothetical protein